MIKDYLPKKASVLSDYFGAVPGNMALSAIAPFSVPAAHAASQVLNAANAGGTVLGALGNVPSDEEIAEMNRSELKAFIPGVSPYRMLARARHNAKKTGGEHPNWNVYGETFGGVPSMLVSTITGAALGALASQGFVTSDNERIRNGVVGGLIGAGIPLAFQGIGALAAAITRRRTKQEQREHDDSKNLSNWLIPGVAAYNKYKRIGRMLDEEKGDNLDKTASGETAIDNEAQTALLSEALLKSRKYIGAGSLQSVSRANLSPEVLSTVAKNFDESYAPGAADGFPEEREVFFDAKGNPLMLSARGDEGLINRPSDYLLKRYKAKELTKKLYDHVMKNYTTQVAFKPWSFWSF